MLYKKYNKIKANQYPDRKNFILRAYRGISSFLPYLGIINSPLRPLGISVIMRVKDEEDWILSAIKSIEDIADEIIVVDNGSIDNTYQILEDLAISTNDSIRLWRRTELDICSLTNFALEQTKFRWVLRWDGDMIAQTAGRYSISSLKKRLLSLDSRRYYLIYLRHINLSGDLFHQDPKEMVHIEEYIHTYSENARYIHTGQFEAIRVPKYYRVLFWYEPYSFHLNVKPARKVLLRYFWNVWFGMKLYHEFPDLEDYVQERIEEEFGTNSWQKAECICVQRAFRDHVRYDPKIFGPYPELLEPYLKEPRYRLEYQNGKIVGREEQ
jgi:glycosyltransferase involved in cell wall biosynthesis